MTVLLVVSLAACSNENNIDEAGGDSTIKIGMIGPLECDYSVYGTAVRNGADLAIKEYNEKNGTNFKLVAYDSKGDNIMSKHNFHRLPVVDDNNIIGLITEGIISENAPSKATSLSIYELNHLLSKQSVKDIMNKDVICVSQDIFLEEAATIMWKHDISCLVVTKDNKVIGIITQNDIFSSFIDLLGYNQNGTRYVIKMDEDKPGMFLKVVDYLAKENVNISNIAIYHTSRGIEVALVTTGENSDEAKIHLEKEGYIITDMLKTHQDD